MNENISLRFGDYVVRGEPDECWPWTGGMVDGYGQFRVDGDTRVMAHRYAYELEHGPIPPFRNLFNLCGRRDCCNPRHWEVPVRA